jgi:translocation and assembly module TamB
MGVTLNNIAGAVSGAVTTTGQDSINVVLAAVSQGETPGSVAISGWVKNLFQSKTRQPFDFTLTARSFHAFDKRSLADLYLTTTQPLQLTGSIQAATLTGALLVPRGAIFLMDRDLARKQAVERIADTTAFGGRSSSVPLTFSTLMSNLQISNVTVTLGNDVYLRSAEANVKLAGELRLEPSTVQSTRTLASGELVPRLSLFGTLRTVGGHYNLNLGLVQREFQVLSDGSVTFTGPPENPTLDVRARYNVRQYRDRDLGIIVKLQGPLLPYPGISFTSTADYDIATSDLVSYLLTGKPGFDFGANPATTQVLSSFLAPTVSAYTSERLRQSFGSFFDVFQFQLGTSGNAQAGSGFLSTDNLSQYLYGSTIGAEKQFKNNLYLSVNTGLCQFDPHSNTSFNNLNLFGAKIEYRIRSDLSTQLAYDPPTLARTCSQGGQNITGLVPTPGQFSLGLFHTWRF